MVAFHPYLIIRYIKYPRAEIRDAMKAIEIVPPTIPQMIFKMMSNIVSIMLLFNIVLILYYKDTTKK